jgi:hypothetical protein
MKDIRQYIRVSEVLHHFAGLHSIPLDILRRASERGTLVHENCDAMIMGLGTTFASPQIVGYIVSFGQWAKNKKFIEKPQRFFCDELMLTGECDGIYIENDSLILIDIKTPRKESKTWRLQLSAYAYLARKAGYDIKRIEAIKLSKEGKPPKIYPYEEDFNMFMKCFEIYKFFFKELHPDEEEEGLLECL